MIPIRKPKTSARQADDPLDMPVLPEWKQKMLLRQAAEERDRMDRLKQRTNSKLLPVIIEHIKKWGKCKLCPLGQSCFGFRKVHWRGSLPADVVFLGEYPGISEETIGKPFVGPSGRQLDRIVDNSSMVAFGRINAYTWCMLNSVACLPYFQGDTKSPKPSEMRTCSPRVRELLKMANPSVIVCVGDAARKALSFIDLHALEVDRVPVVCTITDIRKWFEKDNNGKPKHKVDIELEVKRASLTLASVLEKHVVPF